QTLLESGDLDGDCYLAAMARDTGVTPIRLQRVEVGDDLVDLLPENLAKYYNVVPVAKVGKVLTVAVSDPFDIVKLDDIAMVTSCVVRPVLSTDFTIGKSIAEKYNQSGRKVQDLIDGMGIADDLDMQEVTEEDDDDDFLEEGQSSPVVKLVNLIIYQAIRDKASDIHVEPFEKQVRVRYRMDGVLKEVMQPPLKMHNSLVSRVKIMCGLDIAERNKPQDGKFQLKVEGRQIDFRVSTLPMVHGEKIVLRILDSSNLALSLESLGFEQKALDDIRHAISQPYGMMLVTGPTGSGKSTTLYSSIKEVLCVEENIVTVEDPVEYQLHGVNQVPVNPKRGLTFAGALRSILRQDPDTIMIGEIRDLETIEIAIKAALTGHLVFSTLHTNDAPSTITRMIDMGVDPFLVASATQCVAAQRLARRLCNDCKRPMEQLPPPERLLALGVLEEELDQVQIFEPVGCKYCQAGYRGRFALLETMPMTEDLRRIIISGGSALDIKETAMNEGLISLRRAGLLNMFRGKTSIEELLRVTIAD
ncbi:MAG: Flp pilus assembly complex ATPase component TadA, partial [Planctomycetes bacterium]|nr:Flp pilus assembly complex ATPase component TadA [Planctomycetota bacterium]